MKLIGLDFETANYRKGSICAAGLALIENGVLLDKRDWLIRPHRSMDWMLAQFTDVHGLDYYQLRSCPEFGEVWPVMADFIARGELVVIHNAPFDLGHLQAGLELYGTWSFSFEYVCTLRLCRRLFPEMKSHALDKMATRFRLEFCHHDALDDAITCAMIASQCNLEQKYRKKFEFIRTGD